MSAVRLITRKREGQKLSQSDMEAFAFGAADGSWAAEQISAMLMAMFIRGLDEEETAALTLAMAASGEQLDLSAIPGIKVDKHSTGGVADTTTLILAPLVASCDVPVMKMSGRGLGFTGGTIDKLSAIPGMNTELPIEKAIEQVRKIGLAIVAQSARLAPADKTLYAIRDISGTIDSIPLIAASIMSKKIAAGADAIVLDVKCGNGAFMRSYDDAERLARAMVAIGRQVGRRITAVITDMNQPLGNTIGNAVEVQEAVDVLSGRASGDLLEVCLILGAEMLSLGGRVASAGKGRALLLRQLENGQALNRFRAFISAQGGDSAFIERPDKLPQPKAAQEWLAPRSGFVRRIHAAGLGKLSAELGAGRQHKEDEIDLTAGLVLHARLGEFVERGDPLVRVQGKDAAKVEAVLPELARNIEIGDEKPPRQPLVLGTVRSSW